MAKSAYVLRSVLATCASVWAFAAPVWAGAAGGGRMLDRVVAAVEGRAITLSELSFEARVALVQQGGLEAATAALDDALLASALDVMIGQRVLLVEAERLGAFTIEEQELERAIAAFRTRFQSEPAYQRFLAEHDADVQALASLIARQLRAARILDSKVRLRAQVSDADVKRYYDAHAAELGAPLETLRGPLREKLMRERYAELAAQEIKEARRAADVRLIAPFARAAAQGRGP